jgi:mono/diheme cytochrome c family protein
MPNLISLALIAGLASASLFGVAQQPTTKVKDVPIQPTSAVSGPQMYSTYCATCHGIGGTGNGPAAPAMKVHPTDLTVLSQNNGGAFPAEHIRAILKFGVETPAHGSAEMPVWGSLLRSLNSTGPNPTVIVDQRINNLTNYLKEMQKK